MKATYTNLPGGGLRPGDEEVPQEEDGLDFDDLQSKLRYGAAGGAD